MTQRGPQVLVTLVFSAILLSAGVIPAWSWSCNRGIGRTLFELFTHTPTVAHLRAYEQDARRGELAGQAIATLDAVRVSFCC